MTSEDGQFKSEAETLNTTPDNSRPLADGQLGWKVCDRVQRHSDIFNRSSRLLHGEVVAVRWIGTDVIYDVLWDGRTKVQRGYLLHGLSKETVDA